MKLERDIDNHFILTLNHEEMEPLAKGFINGKKFGYISIRGELIHDAIKSTKEWAGNENLL